MIVKNVHPFVTYVDSTFLIPGNNTLSVEQSKRIAKLPAFQEKVKTGALVIVRDDTGEDNTELKAVPNALPMAVKNMKKTDLTKMNAETAIKVITDMYNVSELRELLKKEIRKTVKLAIRTQLKNIDDAAKKKENKDDADSNVYED